VVSARLRALCGVLLAMLVLTACGEGEAVPIARVQVQGGAEEVIISAPKPRSPRARTLAALAQARNLVLYSVEAYSPPDRPGPRPQHDRAAIEAYDRAESEAADRNWKTWCTREPCLHGNRILGKTPVLAAADRAAVLTALRESLGQVPDHATACVPEYRHAVSFDANGHRFDVLLCYRCGQVAVAVDGEIGFDEQTWKMGDEGALDAILTRAGIALAPKW
jgi:hypothetical protein